MYVISIVLLAIAVILFISIAKVYRSIPLIELKRRARAGQQPAKSLYKVASYQYSSQFLLLAIAIICSAVFFVLIAKHSPIWVALIADATLIWLAYVWIPRSAINIISQYFAQVLAKPLGWILQYFHPIVSYFHKSKPKKQHTGLYEQADIIRLLSDQKKQTDNRIEDFELDLLKHVVNFGHKTVFEIMTPKRKVHDISIDAVLGPVVLSELHKTKHSYFPVYESKTSNIVGILSLARLPSIKNTVSVADVSNPTIYYIHEEQTLSEVLHVMLQTTQEMFIVINSEGEYIGIITARDILKNLVGEEITEEFDSYDNRELVAKKFKVEEEIEKNSHEDTTELIE